MENRELFLTSKACAMQCTAPIPLGDNAHLYFMNGYKKWIARDDATGKRVEMNEERLHLLREALFNTDEAYISIPLTVILPFLFKNNDWDYMLSNNGSGIIKVVEKGDDYKICEFNSCSYFVVDLLDRKLYVERLYKDVLFYYFDASVEYFSAKEFRTKVHNDIAYKLKRVVDSARLCCNEVTSGQRNIVLALAELHNRETFLAITKEQPDSDIVSMINNMSYGAILELLNSTKYNLAVATESVRDRLKDCLAIKRDNLNVLSAYHTFEGLHYFRIMHDGDVVVPFVLFGNTLVWLGNADLPAMLEDLINSGEDSEEPWIAQYLVAASELPRSMSLDDLIEKAKRDWDELEV